MRTFVSGLLKARRAVTFASSVAVPRSRWELTTFKQHVASIHFYPFVVVIEKHDVVPEQHVADRRGTEWQPFSIPADARQRRLSSRTRR